MRAGVQYETDRELGSKGLGGELLTRRCCGVGKEGVCSRLVSECANDTSQPPMTELWLFSAG